MVLVEEIDCCSSPKDARNNEIGNNTTTPSRCVTRSMTASQELKKMTTTTTTPTNCTDTSSSCTCCNNKPTKNSRGERTKRSRSSCNGSRRKSRSNKRRKCNTTNSNDTTTTIELSDLSEEVLIAILEHVSAPGLVSMSKTSWLFHRICHTDTLWKHRCRVKTIFYFTFSSTYLCSFVFVVVVVGLQTWLQSSVRVVISDLVKTREKEKRNPFLIH